MFGRSFENGLKRSFMEELRTNTFFSCNKFVFDKAYPTSLEVPLSNEKKRYLVTAALPYANGPAHLGHVAGVYLPADIYCRYSRMAGRDIVFICGSDEHGVPIMLSARREGVSPQEIVDRYHEELRLGFERMRVSFDYYGRTSDELHRQTSQEFFELLADKGAFETRTETQLYDPEAELFLADRLVKGECPGCGFLEAYGDQCEKCGRALSPAELINPRSTVTNAVPEVRETTHWYLPLDQAQAWLESWIATKTDWKPNVLGQVKSWLQAGLASRSMTRDLPWGVPVPKSIADRDNVDAEGKVLYVWFDAPIGYISATRAWAERQGEPDAWKRYWQDDDTSLVHFYAKDNVVFHAIIFPTMLKKSEEYILPDQEPGNEYLNVKGLKFSTSRGSAIWLNDFLDRHSADYLRYGLSRMLPETKDSEFSWEGLQSLVNSELADTFGNFVNRTMTFAHKHFDGVVPPCHALTDLDRAIIEEIAETPRRVGESIDKFRLREAADGMMSLARAGNKYFNDAQPWVTRKSDMDRCATTIHLSLQVCAALSVIFEPLLPDAAESLRLQLGLSKEAASMPGASPSALSWQDATRSLLVVGSRLSTPKILFQKMEDAVVTEENERFAPQEEVTNEAPYSPIGETTTFDDFLKLDLRVAEIIAAEPVPKSKKLLKIQVNLGFEERQILSGIAQHVSPEALVGQKVVIVANLAPRKMMGLESNGMILMAENRDGHLECVRSDGEPGSTVS